MADASGNNLICILRRPPQITSAPSRPRSIDRLQYDRISDSGDEPAEVRSVCAWLLAKGDGGDFMRSLAHRMARCWVRSPFDGEHAVLRYWDSRLTPHLPCIFGAETWAERLAALGLHAWWCLDDDGQPLSFTAVPEMLDALSKPMPSWHVDDERGLALARIHWANRACQLLPQWDEVSAGIDHETVRTLVDRTAHYGLRSEADVLRFVHSALSLHAHFDSHPQVAAALADFKAEGCQPGAFACVVQKWNDEFRSMLRTGSWMRSGVASPS